MSKFNVIKAGYRVTIESWENDGDNNNTMVKDGMSFNEVKFLKKMTDLVDRNSDFSNLYDPRESEVTAFAEAIRKVLEENIHLTDDPIWKEVLSEGNDSILEYYTESMYDYGLTCGEFYTRVRDGFKVEYFPEDIQIQDVTDQF